MSAEDVFPAGEVLLHSGLHYDDPALAAAVRRLGLNRPPPGTPVAAEARRIVQRGLRRTLLALAKAHRKRELEAQWRNSPLSLSDLALVWSQATAPSSWQQLCPTTGKVRHRREYDALEVLAAIQRSGRGQGEVAVYWHCECSAFHFGRTPGRRTGPLRVRSASGDAVTPSRPSS